MVDEKQYKAMKEAFVSDLHGSDPLTVVLVLMAIPASYALLLAADARMRAIITKRWQQYIFAMLVVMLPLLIQMTLAPLADESMRSNSHHTLTCLLGSMSAAKLTLLAVLAGLTAAMAPTKASEGSTLRALNASVKYIVTYYRAAMMTATCIAILAVDFHVFPRSLAKTERFGTALMDVGVGSVVFSMAIVSPHARLARRTPSLLAVLPLLVLGAARAIGTAAVGYQHHLSEYGVHWNFFLTLAVISVTMSAVPAYVMRRCQWWHWLTACGGLVAVHQAVLSSNGVSDFLLSSASREFDGFLAANREGVASCVGFVAVYIGGVACGRYLLAADGPLRSWRQWQAVARHLWLATAVAALACVLCSVRVQEPSRRLANASYVLFALAVNAGTLAALLSLTMVIGVREPEGGNAWVLHCGAHQLFVFLTANVGTGIINMSMRTLFINHGGAMAVIGLYVLAVAAALYVRASA